jgi:hypothetical protein
MRVAWEDALAVLAAIAEPKDHHVRAVGVFSVDAAGAPQMGLALDGRVVHDALLTLSDLGYVEWDGWRYSRGPTLRVTELRVTGPASSR